MALTPYQQFCHRTFGKTAKKYTEGNYELKMDLEKARIEMLPEAYTAYVWMNTIIAAVVGAVVGVALFFIIHFIKANLPDPESLDALQRTQQENLVGFLDLFSWLIIPIALAIPVVVYAILKFWPSLKVSSRAKDIDNKLPYAVNFIAAMSAAHATPQMIFRSLGKQEKIYGEVANEAKWIYEDMTIFGYDLISALKRAVARAPSDRFQEFIQGVIGTLTSGGNLKLYFLNRAEYYMRENRREQKDFIESLAIMAESYVVVAVAMPIFLMIIMVITLWVSGTGFTMGADMLYLIVFVMLPVIHVGYAYTIYAMAPKI